MNEKKTILERLTQTEQVNVTGGIPYEKPMFILLDSGFVDCTHGTICTNGNSATSCDSGTSCENGGGGKEPNTSQHTG
jgi:hypothetical protein